MSTPFLRTLQGEERARRFAKRYVAPVLPRSKEKGPAFLQGLDIPGAGTRIRTGDLLITNQLLYQLSYAGEGLRF